MRRIKKNILNKINNLSYKFKFKAERFRMEIEKYRYHQIGICGNYTTGNLGDHAIGEALWSTLKKKGYDVQKYHKYIGSTKSKYTILGGGGVIHDHILGALKKRLSFLNRNSMMIGIGYQYVGSETGVSILRRALNRAKVVTVRDKRSYNKISKLCNRNIELTACPAFLLDEPDVKEMDQTGINFRPWFGIGAYGNAEILSKYFEYPENLDVENAANQYLKNMKYICENVKNPIFIPLNPGEDLFAKKYLDIPTYSYKPCVKTALKRIASVKKMVCTRYHSNVFSILCNKPMLSISYAPKVAELAERADVNHYSPNALNIELDFKKPSNRNEILFAAKRNIKLISNEIVN